MSKYLIITLGCIFGVLVFMYTGITHQRIEKALLPPRGQIHAYNNPQIPIQNIHAIFLYFVPKNKTESAIPDWRELLETNAKKLREFHAIQFHKRSTFGYQIYPRPVIGMNDNLFYDTEITQHGNPEALRRVAKELEERVLRQGGDLYHNTLASPSPGTYRVIIVMYEGVGASGSENVAFISRVFLSDAGYRTIAASALAHEFYHTLGIPDAYQLPEDIPYSEDIMGLGRTKPIEKTYIEKNTRDKLGF